MVALCSCVCSTATYRALVAVVARELVQFARQEGYRVDELLEIIEDVA